MTAISSGSSPARPIAPNVPIRKNRAATFIPKSLLRVALRQDLRRIAPWIIAISVLSASSVLAYIWIFPSQADRAELAGMLGANPALALIFGPANDLLTADGFNAWRAGQLGAFFAGLMTILIVVRNSRADEDSGQAELIASSVISRHARLAVALMIAVIASITLGVVCFLLTIASGGGTIPTLMLALTFTASGLMFAGIAAIAAQLASEARIATALAVVTLGGFYVLRGYLDSSGAPHWATWLTPYGWLEATRSGSSHNPWPFALALGFALVTVVIAFVLQSRRDFGQGIIPSRPGPAEAHLARNVWGLTLKIHRGTVIGWLIGLTGLGLIFGTVASSVGGLIEDSLALAGLTGTPAAGPVNATAITFAFLVTIMAMIAIITAIMGVQIMLRILAEETAYRVEPLLAGALSRHRYLASNVLLACGAAAAGLALGGLGLGLVTHAQDPSVSVATVFQQALVTIPAVWVLVSLAVVAVGAFPTRSIIAWMGVVATFGLTILGPSFKLPDWALDISPLRHVPNLMAAQPNWSGFAGLIGIAGVFLAIGFVSFRRRDVL